MLAANRTRCSFRECSIRRRSRISIHTANRANASAFKRAITFGLKTPNWFAEKSANIAPIPRRARNGGGKISGGGNAHIWPEIEERFARGWG